MKWAVIHCIIAAAPVAAAQGDLPASASPRPKIYLAGAAEMVGNRLRLTPAVPQLAGAAWLDGKQVMSGGFEVKFQFQITQQGGLGPGADGLAFVIQNQGIDALAGRGSSGGFAIGDGKRDWSIPGIPRSIAVFFDTFQNGDADDPSDNYVAVCTNGPSDRMHWPPRRLAVARKLGFRLKDGKPHEVRIVYKPPFLLLYLDDGEPALRTPVDLSKVVDESGAAYVGFTASTGNGFQNHDIIGWSFSAKRPVVSSDIAVVTSEIHFAPDNCLPDRNLCTPREAKVQELGSNHYSIVLPPHLARAASIPNPLGKPVTVSGARGTICFDIDEKGSVECSGPEGIEGLQLAAKERATLLSAKHPPGALIVESKDGHTRFSVNVPQGRGLKRAQGMFEFEVRLD